MRLPGFALHHIDIDPAIGQAEMIGDIFHLQAVARNLVAIQCEHPNRSLPARRRKAWLRLKADRHSGMNAGMATPLLSLDRLAQIMARLRHPQRGCPWDLAQDFDTIAPYTIEEAYEVAEAIAARDWAELGKELGDLLFQVVFHAQLAEEAGHFTLSDVVTSLCEKMERRHPHIFGDGTRAADADAQKLEWERIKAEERSAAGKASAPVSALDGVATALPALMRAEKLQARAARVGFEWPDVAGVRAKVEEELAEFDTATTAAHRAEELGDLLFVIANLARRHGIDPETALRAGNAKFERRFRGMEALADQEFAGLPLEAKEALWRQVKQSERSPAS